jgi:hypothetical protein
MRILLDPNEGASEAGGGWDSLNDRLWRIVLKNSLSGILEVF